jgi:hypothetical protein
MADATDGATAVHDAVAALETRLRADTGSVVSTIVARGEAVVDLHSLVRSVECTVHDPEPLHAATLASLVDALVELAKRDALAPERVATGFTAAVRADARGPANGIGRHRALTGIRALATEDALSIAPPALRSTLVATFLEHGRDPMAAALEALVDSTALPPADLADRLARDAPEATASGVPSWFDAPTPGTLALLETATARDPDAFQRYAPALRRLLGTDVLDTQPRVTVVRILQRITTAASTPRSAT